MASNSPPEAWTPTPRKLSAKARSFLAIWEVVVYHDDCVQEGVLTNTLGQDIYLDMVEPESRGP
jgi:hypothetical protein